MIILLYIFAGCTTTYEKKTIPKQLQTIKFNEVAASTNNIVDIINKISIIPLETNEYCLIGRIEKALIKNNRIYIHDYDNKTLFVFNINGNFLFKIHSAGKGPEEYIILRDFLVKNNKILILGSHGKILEYSMNGQYLRTNKVKIFSKKFGSLDNGTTYFWTGSTYYKENNYSVFKTDINYKFVSYHFPYSGKRLISSSNMFTKYNGCLYFKPSRFKNGNVVYCLTSDKIFPKYELDFGKKTWPKKSLKYQQLRKLIDEGHIYAINNFFENDIFITFNFVKKSMVHCAIFLKHTNKTLWWSSNYSICLERTAIKHVTTVDSLNFYSTIDPLNLKEYIYEYMKYDSIHNNFDIYKQKDVFNLISNIKETDNPIIFKVAFKNE